LGATSSRRLLAVLAVPQKAGQKSDAPASIPDQVGGRKGRIPRGIGSTLPLAWQVDKGGLKIPLDKGRRQVKLNTERKML